MENEDDIEERFIICLALVNSYILTSLAIAIIYIIIFLRSEVVQIFDFFDKSNFISFITTYDSTKLILFFSSIFIFMYIFGYIRANPLTIFDKEGEGTKYMLIFDKCIEIFTPLIVILLFSFYLWNIGSLTELICISVLFVFNVTFSKILFETNNKIKYKHASIRKINGFRSIRDVYLKFTDGIGARLKLICGFSDIVKDSFLFLSLLIIIR